MQGFGVLDVFTFRDKKLQRATVSRMKAKEKLVIHLDCLPDISSVRDLERYGYRNYGRFAVLRDGQFWVQTLRSTYPAEMETGWFWAIDNDDRLVVSARGAVMDGESLFTRKKHILAQLVQELVNKRILSRPRAISTDWQSESFMR